MGRFAKETTVGSTLWTGVEEARGGAFDTHKAQCVSSHDTSEPRQLLLRSLTCCFSGKADIVSFSWRPMADMVSKMKKKKKKKNFHHHATHKEEHVMSKNQHISPTCECVVHRVPDAS